MAVGTSGRSSPRFRLRKEHAKRSYDGLFMLDSLQDREIRRSDPLCQPQDIDTTVSYRGPTPRVVAPGHVRSIRLSAWSKRGANEGQTYATS